MAATSESIDKANPPPWPVAAALWVADALSVRRSLAVLLPCSGAAGLVYCILLFGWDFIIGRSDYWNSPGGLVPNSFADSAMELGGYYYFLQESSFHVPLFWASKLAGGINIVFTDSIPLVALAGRGWFLATGDLVNAYGFWIAICFIGSAVSLSWLVGTVGVPNLASTFCSTATGLCMLALLYRWGHLSLMAQFEIVLALIFAVTMKRRFSLIRCVTGGVGLCWLALWTQSYLFVMVSGIVVATALQAIWDRQLGTAGAVGLISALLAAIAALIGLSGHFSGAKAFTAPGFGYFSMNLAAPFLRDLSLVLGAQGDLSNPTGGQYEGFCYLGAGIWALVVAMIPILPRIWTSAASRYPCLMYLLVCYTIFAASFIVYAGSHLVAVFPIPEIAQRAAGAFRSSGRFVWPAMFGAAAVAIAKAARPDRAGAMMLILAGCLQVADTTELRSALARAASEPATMPFDPYRLLSAIRTHSYVHLAPTFSCIPLSDLSDLAISAEIEMLAAKADVPTNSVYAARQHEDCNAVEAEPPRGAISLELLHAGPALSERPGETCVASAEIRACSGVLSQGDLRKALIKGREPQSGSGRAASQITPP